MAEKREDAEMIGVGEQAKDYGEDAKEYPLRVMLEHISGIRLSLELLPPSGRPDDVPELAKEDYEEALDAMMNVVASDEFGEFAKTRLSGGEVSVKMS
jgi:NADH:ubiquinone oxidoreductase subunit D